MNKDIIQTIREFLNAKDITVFRSVCPKFRVMKKASEREMILYTIDEIHKSMKIMRKVMNVNGDRINIETLLEDFRLHIDDVIYIIVKYHDSDIFEPLFEHYYDYLCECDVDIRYVINRLRNNGHKIKRKYVNELVDRGYMKENFKLLDDNTLYELIIDYLNDWEKIGEYLGNGYRDNIYTADMLIQRCI